jgi:hypothetical protein
MEKVLKIILISHALINGRLYGSIGTHSLYPELFPHKLSHQVSNFAAKGESVKKCSRL